MQLADLCIGAITRAERDRDNATRWKEMTILELARSGTSVKGLGPESQKPRVGEAFAAIPRPSLGFPRQALHTKPIRLGGATCHRQLLGSALF